MSCFLLDYRNVLGKHCFRFSALNKTEILFSAVITFFTSSSQLFRVRANVNITDCTPVEPARHHQKPITVSTLVQFFLNYHFHFFIPIISNQSKRIYIMDRIPVIHAKHHQRLAITSTSFHQAYGYNNIRST